MMGDMVVFSPALVFLWNQALRIDLGTAGATANMRHITKHVLPDEDACMMGDMVASQLGAADTTESDQLLPFRPAWAPQHTVPP